MSKGHFVYHCCIGRGGFGKVIILIQYLIICPCFILKQKYAANYSYIILMALKINK